MVPSSPAGSPLPPPRPPMPPAQPSNGPTRHGPRPWLLPVAMAVSMAVGAGATALVFLATDDAEQAVDAVAPTTSAPTTSDPTEDQYAEDFADLLVDIEMMETITLEYRDAADLAEKAFEANWAPGSSYTRFRQLADAWWSGATRAHETFEGDLTPLLADFQARAFTDDEAGGRLRQIRDVAVDRYEAWIDFAPVYNGQIIEWSYGEESSTWQEFSGDTLDPMRERITGTFRALCDSISVNQPPDGAYSTQISEVCQY